MYKTNKGKDTSLFTKRDKSVQSDFVSSTLFTDNEIVITRVSVIIDPINVALYISIPGVSYML